MPIQAKKPAAEKTETAAPSVTVEQIDAMMPPQLRKAIKDAGGDPKGMDADTMKTYLKEHHGLTKKEKAKGGKPAAAPKSEPAAKPEKTAEKPKAEPVKTEEVKKPEEAATDAERGPWWNKMPAEFRSYLQKMELDIATCLDAVGISSGRTSVPAAGAVDEYAIIRQFIKPKMEKGKPVLDAENNPVEELDMSAEEIQKSSKEQLLKVAEIMGLEVEKMKKMEVREIRPLIAQQFGNTGASAEEPVKKASSPFKKAEAAAPTPAAEPTFDYQPGHVVKCELEGKIWDPCLVLTRTVTKKRNVEQPPVFDIFFNEDGTNMPMQLEDLKGLSKKKITEDPKACGWEGDVPAIIKA